MDNNDLDDNGIPYGYAETLITHQDYVKLSDDEILDLQYMVKQQMSGFNAAEGNWTSETNGRNLCRARMLTIGNEVEQRGLTPKPGTFLL